MLREIQTFVTASRVGTFTEAGERLGLTQSAVSDQIKRFEAYVGRKLFYRTGRSATLNAAGADILPLAEQMLDLADQMQERSAPGQLRGTLRVGSIASMYNGLLTRTVQAFCDAHPRVTVRLLRGEDGAALSLMERVAREQVDMAIVILPDDELPLDIEAWPILRKEHVVIAPKTCKSRTWRAAIRSNPLIRYESKTITGLKIDAFLARHEISAQESIHMNYYETMVSFVARGMGVSIVPEADFGPAADQIKIFRLGEDTFYRDIGLLQRRGEKSPAFEAFRAALGAEAANEDHSLVLAPPPIG